MQRRSWYVPIYALVMRFPALTMVLPGARGELPPENAEVAANERSVRCTAASCALALCDDRC
eukprot:784185-Rhodomonas_salina.3